MAYSKTPKPPYLFSYPLPPIVLSSVAEHLPHNAEFSHPLDFLLMMKKKIEIVPAFEYAYSTFGHTGKTTASTYLA